MMKLTLMILSCVLALPIARAFTVADDAESIVPVAKGQVAPDAMVKTVDGEPFDLGEAVRGRPTVLIFYRGGWCPYCVRHLAALQEIEGELIELGYQIMAVSPDKPEALQPTTKEHGLHYQLFSDREMKAASAYGVAFRVPNDIRTRYEGHGFDLAPMPDGQDARWLPVPAVFLINDEGVVSYVHTNPDYRLRLDPADVLQEAKAALK